MAILESQPADKFRRFEYFWLVYLAFFFIEPVMRASLHYWLENLGIVAIFLALYVQAVGAERKPTSFQLTLLGGMWLLGVVTMPLNGGAVAFIIYAAALLPFVAVPFAWIISGLASISVLLALECRLVHFNLISTVLDVFFALVAGGGNVIFAQKQRSGLALRAALDENLALAAVAERERIARDLHDVLGHTLSVVVLKAELAGRLINRQDPNDHTRAAAEIADVERIARTALSEVREAIGGYRTRGLGAEIEAARLTLDAAGVTLILDSAATSTANLSAPEEIALSLALREAITNIVRHSRATTCRLCFITEDSHRRLVIEDNGANSSSQSSLIHEGNGLRGMRERIESLGGHLFLERDNGTRLLIDLPRREPAAS
jgi:two-component system, NarL family, sensor histidine kinase DesK